MGMTMEMRTSILAAVDNVGEVDQAEAWLERNRAALSYVSEMNGCGCCIHAWEIAGPRHVLDTLPSHLRAVTLADTAALCQEGQPQQRRQAGHEKENADNAGTPAGQSAGAAAGRSAVAVPSIGAIVLLGVVYLIFAVPTVLLAVGAYTPCTSNFEGGCGMAKGLAAIISLLPATGAFTMGFVLRARLAEHPTIARRAPTALAFAMLLWIAPLAYTLVTLYVLF
jgi:hypothetical protein